MTHKPVHVNSHLREGSGYFMPRPVEIIKPTGEKSEILFDSMAQREMDAIDIQLHTFGLSWAERAAYKKRYAYLEEKMKKAYEQSHPGF